MARGDVELKKRVNHFTRGLEHLQSLLEYQPIYLVMPDIESELSHRIKQKLRGYAWTQIATIDLIYPQDDFSLLARRLGLLPSGGPVWALRTDGVLAIDRALTMSRHSTIRIVTIGGPGCDNPRHLRAIPGYPLDEILPDRQPGSGVRVVQNGVLTGRQLPEDSSGLSPHCRGYTLLREQQEKEFLGFMRPGWSRPSYSNCFLSAVRPGLRQRFTTALWGERRPCISCIYCEEVCPAGIMPHQIHKYLYQDALEEAEKAGIDRCIGCGLCTYVCPSKIELRSQIIEGQQKVRRELHPEEETE